MIEIQPCSRYTPTHVGKTVVNGTPLSVQTVHPHTRGENYMVLVQNYPRHGTPPHTWGKLIRIIRMTPIDRYTPTHVGKTFCGRMITGVRTVHPHTRGENDLLQ